MQQATTILLIDDDEDDRELFQLAIEEVDPNINYVGASSCYEALSLLKEKKITPDYIFLDLNMPKMNGKECLCELKKNANSESIPVIIFSTSNDPRVQNETARLGAVGFITKPAKNSELARILNNFLVNQTIK